MKKLSNSQKRWFLAELDTNAKKTLTEKEYKTWLELMDKLIIFVKGKKDDK